eukprot:403344131
MEQIEEHKQTNNIDSNNIASSTLQHQQLGGALDLEDDYNQSALFFSKPKFDNLIDRYYQRYYRRITPQTISQMMGFVNSDAQLKQDGSEKCLDQFYFMHSNQLVLFGISNRHEAIKNNDTNPIVSVNFDCDRKQKRGDSQVKGKSKSGAIKLDPRTMLCEIKCQDGTYYKIRSFVKNAQILEMNKRLCLNPQLLASKSESEGYIAIFSVKKGQNLNEALQMEDLVTQDKY